MTVCASVDLNYRLMLYNKYGLICHRIDPKSYWKSLLERDKNCPQKMKDCIQETPKPHLINIDCIPQFVICDAK